MRTQLVVIQDEQEGAITGSRALLWGNNAAWLCTECNTLLGNRTGDNDFLVGCQCGTRYEILRSPNRNGRLHLGPATGVRRLYEQAERS